MEHRNVDTGMGLERTLVTLNGYASVYETDVFDFAIKKLEELSGKKHGEEEESTVAMRIIADHTRTATFLLGDIKPVTPSNVIRAMCCAVSSARAMRYCRVLGVEFEAIGELAMLFRGQIRPRYIPISPLPAHASPRSSRPKRTSSQRR